MESDTERIAHGLRQKNVAVLEKLVEEYQYRLVRYLVSLLGRRDGVDDLVQETWLRVLERGASYDGRSRFEPWLFRVARNIALDAMRKPRMFSLDSDEEDIFRSSPASSEPSPYALAARTRERLRRSVCGTMKPLSCTGTHYTGLHCTKASGHRVCQWNFESLMNQRFPTDGAHI